MAAPSTPQLAAFYLTKLDAELRNRQTGLNVLENYYEGRHNLVFATSRFRQAFGNLFHEFADNWMALIVDASVERLNIHGFRLDGADDELALLAWDENYLEGDSVIAHTEAVKLGKSYLLLSDREDELTDSGFGLITVEHPLQVIVACDPARRRKRIAALKEWTGDDGYVYANVYFEDKFYRFQTDSTIQQIQHAEPGMVARGDVRVVLPDDFDFVPAAALGREAYWIPVQDEFDPVQEHSFGVVPVICLDNNPTLRSGGISDIANVIPIQNAINKTAMDMVIASEYAAFAQRWATGIEIPKDEETGRAMSDEAFLASVARVWAVEDEHAKFGQFEASDLKNYVHAIEMLIQHLAALTRTPPHYLLGQSGNFPSGDSLTATETGLVAKVKRKMRDFSPSWEEAVKLSISVKTPIKRANAVWGDPEQRIRATRVDAAMKLSDIGVPQDTLWAEAGFSPEDVIRMHEERMEMGLPEYGSEFAPLSPDQKLLAQSGQKQGPEGNAQQSTQLAQTERVSRIND